MPKKFYQISPASSSNSNSANLSDSSTSINSSTSYGGHNGHTTHPQPPLPLLPPPPPPPPPSHNQAMGVVAGGMGILLSRSSNSTGYPLPDGWDVATDNDGKIYYIDHNTKSTTWIDPRDR